MCVSELQTLTRDLHDFWTRDPNACVSLGVLRNLDRLPDPSLAYRAARIREIDALLTKLEATRRTGSLTSDQQLDVSLAELMLSAERHRSTYRFNGDLEIEQKPTAGSDIGDGIFQLFIHDQRAAVERVRDISARLAQVPEYLSSLRARLTQPVARWVQIDLAKVEGLPSLFETISKFAEIEAPALHRELLQRQAAAVGALADYADHLRALPTRREFHVGEATARAIVSNRGIDLTFAELRTIASAFLARVNGEIEDLRARLTAKYGLAANATVEELERHLKERYRVRAPGGAAAILARYRVERDRILSFVRERELFPILSDQEMRILETPEFMRPSIPAGAMLPPTPFAAGTKTSLVYLTLTEELWPEHTELSIPAMMIHEGIPGHHLQLATAATHPSLIRRHVEAMDQAEGWTTMLEDYMLDIGYMGELTDEARFIGKRDICRIGARVAIDLFFMTGDRSYLDVGVVTPTAEDPFDAAFELLTAVTGFVPGRVRAELNWYSQERGYPLSYLAGNHLVWQLKRDVEAARAGAPSLATDREFHSAFLGAGNMPVSYLRRSFETLGLLPRS